LLVVPGAVGADEKGQEPIHTTTVTQADHQRQSRVCVNHHRGVGFSVLDGETRTRLARVPIGRAPHGIAVSWDGARLFVVNQEDDTVSIIDAHSYQRATASWRSLIAHTAPARLAFPSGPRLIS
jgi:DNA-binding beta-propeller fold protein YncE